MGAGRRCAPCAVTETERTSEPSPRPRPSTSDDGWCKATADDSIERLRLFIAVSVPRSHLERIDEEIAPFRDKVTNARWSPLDNQHVTLKFLGSTPVDRLEHVEKVCAMVAAGRHAETVSLNGVGAFPNRNRVRVLWVGLDDPYDLLPHLATDLDQALEPLGFATESRAFTPHLTLARFRLPVPLKSGLPELDLSDLPEFEVESFELYRSHMSPKGARYEVLESFPLKPAP
jgi:2'-5' RNA ligase